MDLLMKHKVQKHNIHKYLKTKRDLCAHISKYHNNNGWNSAFCNYVKLSKSLTYSIYASVVVIETLTNKVDLQSGDYVCLIVSY